MKRREKREEDTRTREEIHLDIWDRTVDYLKANCDLSDEREYEVLAAWCWATHLMDKWDVYPYLYIQGDIESGKTNLLFILSTLCLNSDISTSRTASATFRRLKESDALTTLFFDEFFTNSKNGRELLRIINGGHSKGTYVDRSEPTGKGGWRVKKYPAGCMKCMSGTERNHGRAHFSRGVTIRMKRTNKRFPKRDMKSGKKLWQEITSLVRKHLSTSECWVASKELDDELFEIAGNSNRLVDIFEPLVLVAPEAKHSVLKEYLNDLSRARIEEEKGTFNYDVCMAIQRVRSDIGRRLLDSQNRFSVNEIALDINARKEFAGDPVSNQRVGYVLTDLGFRRTRMADGRSRGYYWDSRLWESLKGRYKLEEND